MRPATLTLFLLLGHISFASSALAQPAIQFAELEQQLLTAAELSLDFRVSATGAIEVALDGSLLRRANGDIELTAKGVFAGQPVDLLTRHTAEGFLFGHRSNPVSADAPGALWESLVIGFTRMGILHNIANLSAGAMPDHAEGGVSDWVTVTNVTAEPPVYAFDIVVSGTPSGSATLAFESNGIPNVREQVVAFPGGEMRVVETYSALLPDD